MKSGGGIIMASCEFLRFSKFGGNMEEKHHRSSQVIFLALCNFNSIGLGYLLASQKKRWLFVLIGNLGLLVGAYFANASKNPYLWAGIFLLVYIGMAVDLWLLLKKKPELIKAKLTKNAFLLPGMAVLINLVFFGGFFAYRWVGSNTIQKGNMAY